MTSAEPISFDRVGDDYGWLSNSAPYPIHLNGKMWYTAEHYFQACKFHDEMVQRQIQKTRSATEILRIASNPKLKVRRDWDVVKVGFMEQAVRAKFTQMPELRDLLLGTGDAPLIAHSATDSYWYDGGDGTGKNLLGLILMDLRDQLREESSPQDRKAVG